MVNNVAQLSLGIGIVLNIIYLHYVYNLEVSECGCSEDWKRTFIKYYSGLMILQLILMVVFMNKTSLAFSMIIRTLVFITTILSLVQLYALFMYTRVLKNKNCECSESWQREFMYYWSMFMIALIVVNIVITVIVMGLFKAYKFPLNSKVGSFLRKGRTSIKGSRKN